MEAKFAEFDKEKLLLCIRTGSIDETDLLELVSDNDFDIAFAVANCKYATDLILDVAAQDCDERIRLAVVNNNNCSEKTLQYLQKDRNPEISSAATRRLNEGNRHKLRWYCKKCKSFHKEDELCPQIRIQLKKHPEWITYATDFTVVAGEEALVTTQALDKVAQTINSLTGSNLSYEGTDQFARDIQVFRRLNTEPFSKSRAFSTPENAKSYYQNVLEAAKAKPRALTSFESKLIGYSEETEWLRQKHGEISSIWEKSELLSGNAPGVDGITYNRFTGKQISRTTIKASSNPMTKNSTGIRDIKKAITKGYTTEEDIIFGPEGIKKAAEDAGLVNPVIEGNNVQEIRDSIKRLEEKIANGKAFTEPSVSQVGGYALQGAIVGGAISLSVSAITTYARYREGEITREQAYKSISENSLKGALVGGTLGGTTIFLSGGTIGFIAGNAIGIYVNFSASNILDEVFGKGGYETILDSAGYVCGMTYDLDYCFEQIKKNYQITDSKIQETKDTQKRIEVILSELDG